MDTLRTNRGDTLLALLNRKSCGCDSKRPMRHRSKSLTLPFCGVSQKYPSGYI